MAKNEIDRITLHDSEANLCNSKSINQQTAPGIKMFHEEQSNIVHIEYKGKKMRMPITNIKCMYLK